ncbi:tail fiber protein [Leptolyngbya phage LPP-1]|uniref:Tail fiber protein n=1 Tax=Leptolyngbya phage LPP-1 TaxID=2996049 RepID=A0AAE9PS84_9CAUD|nr:tail fiber protein [Leptolyngbya phage LPP-1]
MAISCIGSPDPVKSTETDVKPIDWTPGTKTLLEELAEKRKLALETQAAMYNSVDPQVAKQQAQARSAQEMWEGVVFDAGKRAMLSPTKLRRVEVWLANWLGLKSESMGLIREPLLNIKRQMDGMLRESAIYRAMYDSRQLAKAFKTIAKKRGTRYQTDDLRRILEEGMTPQRLAVYGNTPVQAAELNTRFATWKQGMLDRGFTDDDIELLLDQAQEVSKHFDEIQAVVMASGANINDLNNIGWFPRQFSEDGFQVAKLAGILKDTDQKGMHDALMKSRSTWQYLVEDHTIASRLMGISGDELHALISNPVDFAEFLSKKFKGRGEDLDLLVDSGVMSKIPMLTSHVEEYLSRVYKIPGMEMNLFITDPIEASAQYIKKLQTVVENSSLVKYVELEGIKSGWAITKELFDADPQTFGQYLRLKDIPGLQNIPGGGSYVHPAVAAHLNGILRLSATPGVMGEFANAYSMFTRWFAKQALGNPITAKSYLFGQFFGNMLGAFGRGVQPRHYIASFIDVARVATEGLDALDNTKVFRVIDGQPITHRELVARTLRMFSRELIPGVKLNAGGSIDFSKLNPLYTVHQLQKLYAASTTTAGYAGEVAKLLAGKADSVLTPTLKIAQLMDMAGQLAIVRGKSKLGTQDLGSFGEAAEQLAMGWSIGKIDSWDDLVVEVKRGMPMFDDVGRVPAAIARIAPFSSWAMANLPLQLKSMMREPSRWYNYVRAHALWNSSQLPDDELDRPVNGEMQDWERDMYGMVLQVDPANRKTHMLFTAQFDPRWGVMAAVMKATNGKSPSALRDGTRESSGAKMLREMVGATYGAGIYEAITGVDPATGVKQKDSDYQSTLFANVPMPPVVAGILSISPILQSVDRLEAISGTREVLDPRSGAALRQATQGWLGNKGTRMPQAKLEGVEATLQTIGARVRVIDGLRNMQYTESDTRTAMSKMLSQSFTEQKRLASDLQSGAVARDSIEYKRRVEVVHRMIDSAFQLNLDLKRIEAWAIRNKVPSRDMLQELQDRKLSTTDLPLPGADYIQQQLEQAYKLKGQTP